LMQSLPAIHYSIAAVGAANAVLALPPLAGWQEATLALLGYAGIPRIEIEFDCHYRFQRAHWCAYLNGVAEFFLSPRCLQVVNRLAADAPQIPDGPELIYVSRLDTTHRRIRNEDKARQFLESLGFVTLVPGFLPFATQVGLFSNAHVVVGAHGAGLTNLAFCIPGTIVLELIQSTYANTYFNRIAQLRGLQYHAECFECEPADYVHDQAWTVDIAQLETKLRTLL
jgi:capsular polysaccharide biosynthesis protein